ncbi:MAG: 4Fe-4S dicluster domain-containing protein [Candidatus Bathyarchaeia archaeon]
MGKIFIIDVNKCIGCMSCVISCKDEFVGNDWSPYSKPQPEYGQFWIKVDMQERGSIPKVKVTYIPILCMHCNNPPCMRACLIGAIVKRPDGIVLIDPNKCNGCKPLGVNKPLCIEACPYNIIYFNSELGIAQKCTGCSHLLDDPDWKYGPRCHDACPTGAIIYGDESDSKIKELIRNADVIGREYNTRPRVCYLNLPKPFIAGCVVDFDEKEVVIDAKVTALDLYTGEKHETNTDELGDFWLKDLEWNHKYLIKIEKSGYKGKTLGVYLTSKDINLGTIGLEKG